MNQTVGHFRCYVPWNPKGRSEVILSRAGAILARYEARGMVMTLRQLHYQMLGEEYPNTLKSYNTLKEVVSKGRLAGLLSWTAIEDRGRNLQGLNHYDSPKQAIDRVVSSYRRDLWADQPYRPEVWIEKEAGVGVIAGICNQLRVDFFACKGYNSQSEQWRAGRRFARYVAKGQRPIVFHIGDHDPSGIDMTRDIRDRLEMFAGVPVMVQRLALNIGQVEELNLPPNPAKMSDARADDYVAEFGDSSWELDALQPEYTQKLISDSVLRIRDKDAWERALTRELDEKEAMKAFAETMSGSSDEETEEDDQ